ncbi:MAG: hypothetical protein ACRD8W_14875 [Nitrososphaeraceae archaeon]
MADLRNLDLEIEKIPSGSQCDDTRSMWHSRTFNTLNWLSFLINEKIISDKRIIAHLKPIMISYYEGMFLKYVSTGKTDAESYHDLKKVYRALKEYFR